MMSVITAAGEATPGKLASSRGETVLARQLKKLHADKLQYRRALALQQLARDPDAAIIKHCDYFAVADLFEIIPQLAGKLKL